MMVNPHGLDVKWQVLLINLYGHVMVVDVRAVSSLCSGCAQRRGGRAWGDEGWAEHTELARCPHVLHSVYSPQVPCFLESP